MPAVKFAVDAPQRTKKSTDDKETDWATSFSIQWRKSNPGVVDPEEPEENEDVQSPFDGWEMEGLGGGVKVIRQEWLKDWVVELKDRLPSAKLEELGLYRIYKEAVALNGISTDQLGQLLQKLPEDEVERFEERVVESTAAKMAYASATAMDSAFVDSQVDNAITRHVEEQRDYVAKSYEREAAERAATMEAKPWQYVMDLFSKRVEAARKIQAAFRRFRARCKNNGFYPSDDNPYHWKHWCDFRARHGWADDELVDEYGEPRQRTDGGKRMRNRKQGKRLPHDIQARYLDPTGHLKNTKAAQPLDKATRDALRDYDRAQRMGEIIATRWQRLQAIEERRQGLRAKEKEEMAQMVRENLPQHDNKQEQNEGFIEMIADPEVRELFKQSASQLNEHALSIADTMQHHLSAPHIRDLSSDLPLTPGESQQRIAQLMTRFRDVQMYREQLAASRKAHQPAPPLPEGMGPEMMVLYEDVMQSIEEQYKQDLQDARRKGRPPPPPPEGVSEEMVNTYTEVTAAIRRIETGYDTEDAEDGRPRVRRLTKYGREWLDVFRRSSMSRKRLLRTRSQGVLGTHNWALYRVENEPMPPPVPRSWSTKARRKMALEAGNRDFLPFKPTNPVTDVELAPLTEAASDKLINITKCLHRRRTRPLYLADTQNMDGLSWTRASAVPEGVDHLEGGPQTEEGSGKGSSNRASSTGDGGSSSDGGASDRGTVKSKAQSRRQTAYQSGGAAAAAALHDYMSSVGRASDVGEAEEVGSEHPDEGGEHDHTGSRSLRPQQSWSRKSRQAHTSPVTPEALAGAAAAAALHDFLAAAEAAAGEDEAGRVDIDQCNGEDEAGSDEGSIRVPRSLFHSRSMNSFPNSPGGARPKSAYHVAGSTVADAIEGGLLRPEWDDDEDDGPLVDGGSGVFTEPCESSPGAPTGGERTEPHPAIPNILMPRATTAMVHPMGFGAAGTTSSDDPRRLSHFLAGPEVVIPSAVPSAAPSALVVVPTSTLGAGGLQLPMFSKPLGEEGAAGAGVQAAGSGIPRLHTPDSPSYRNQWSPEPPSSPLGLTLGGRVGSKTAQSGYAAGWISPQGGAVKLRGSPGPSMRRPSHMAPPPVMTHHTSQVIKSAAVAGSAGVVISLSPGRSGAADAHSKAGPAAVRHIAHGVICPAASPGRKMATRASQMSPYGTFAHKTTEIVPRSPPQGRQNAAMSAFDLASSPFEPPDSPVLLYEPTLDSPAHRFNDFRVPEGAEGDPVAPEVAGLHSTFKPMAQPPYSQQLQDISPFSLDPSSLAAQHTSPARRTPISLLSKTPAPKPALPVRVFMPPFRKASTPEVQLALKEAGLYGLRPPAMLEKSMGILREPHHILMHHNGRLLSVPKRHMSATTVQKIGATAVHDAANAVMIRIPYPEPMDPLHEHQKAVRKPAMTLQMLQRCWVLGGLNRIKLEHPGTKQKGNSTRVSTMGAAGTGKHSQDGTVQRSVRSSSGQGPAAQEQGKHTTISNSNRASKTGSTGPALAAGGDVQLLQESLGPMASMAVFFGAAVADAFLEEHRPLIEAAVAKARLGAKAAKQSETTMDRLYKAFGLAQTQARVVASTSIADEAAALDLVEQYRRMHGKAARDNRNVLFRVTSAAVQHITPEARKGIQKRWVSSFMSNKYKYLNENLKLGVRPDELLRKSESGHSSAADRNSISGKPLARTRSSASQSGVSTSVPFRQFATLHPSESVAPRDRLSSTPGSFLEGPEGRGGFDRERGDVQPPNPHARVSVSVSGAGPGRAGMERGSVHRLHVPEEEGEEQGLGAGAGMVHRTELVEQQQGQQEHSVFSAAPRSKSAPDLHQKELSAVLEDEGGQEQGQELDRANIAPNEGQPEVVASPEDLPNDAHSASSIHDAAGSTPELGSAAPMPGAEFSMAAAGAPSSTAEAVAIEAAAQATGMAHCDAQPCELLSSNPATLALKQSLGASDRAPSLSRVMTGVTNDSSWYSSPTLSPQPTTRHRSPPASARTAPYPSPEHQHQHLSAAAEAAAAAVQLSPWGDEDMGPGQGGIRDATPQAAGSQAHTALLQHQMLVRSRPGSGRSSRPASVDPQMHSLSRTGSTRLSLSHSLSGTSHVAGEGTPLLPGARIPMNPYTAAHNPAASSPVVYVPRSLVRPQEAVSAQGTAHTWDMGQEAQEFGAHIAPPTIKATAHSPADSPQPNCQLSTPAQPASSTPFSQGPPSVAASVAGSATPSSRAGMGSRQRGRAQAWAPVFTAAAQDWDWADEPQATPAWLDRLAARTQLAQKVGVGSSNSQRQRFQMAVALQNRSASVQSLVGDAVRITKPMPPPHYTSHPASASLHMATLPGALTRSVCVAGGGGGGGGGGQRGDNTHSAPANRHTPTIPCATAANAKPISDLSPPKIATPAGMIEVLTPFGPRAVHAPAPATPPPRPGGASKRPASHKPRLLKPSTPSWTSPFQGGRQMPVSPHAIHTLAESMGWVGAGDRSSAPAAPGRFNTGVPGSPKQGVGARYGPRGADGPHGVVTSQEQERLGAVRLPNVSPMT